MKNFFAKLIPAGLLLIVSAIAYFPILFATIGIDTDTTVTILYILIIIMFLFSLMAPTVSKAWIRSMLMSGALFIAIPLALWVFSIFGIADALHFPPNHPLSTLFGIFILFITGGVVGFVIGPIMIISGLVMWRNDRK